MARRILATALLTVATGVGSLLPGMAPTAAASSCTGWTSESVPPPTISVYRHVSGAVDVVDFRTYLKNVLSREWIGSWTTESLRSGAQAVRNYAWYQVLHWRGGVNAQGTCFDLRDDTWDQVYDPTKPTWSTAAAAVDDTWSWLVTKNGHIFPTYYNAGTSGEACGANANGWKAYQWGTQACGLAGMAAAQILLTYYYPGVTVSGAPGTSPSPTPTVAPTPSASPTPTIAPTPTPRPTASPTPTPRPSASASALPTATPTSTATPTASPTAIPTLRPTPSPTAVPSPTPVPTPNATPRPSATPTPTPLPAPPAEQQLPGGGQVGVTHASAPPPPPPADPTPVVAAPAPASLSARPAGGIGGSGLLEAADPWQTDGDLSAAPAVTGSLATTGDELARLDAALAGGMGPTGAGPRLATFRALIGPAMDDLVRALGVRFGSGRLVALLLGHS